MPDAIASTKPPRRLKRLFAFRGDERGSTALEFAILAVPFFAVVGAILETSLVFLASQVLDSAVQDSSRLVRTGQAQAANFNIGNFRDAVCQGLFNMFDCNKLQIRVHTVTNFTTANTATTPLDPTDPTKWTLIEDFVPGTGSNVVMVQVYYKWPIILNFGGLNLATSSDGTHLLGSVRVFENEPFT